MRLLLGCLFLSLYSMSAWAHPGHDHMGLWSGLLHPFSGIDHLLIASGLGLWAAHQQRQAPTIGLLGMFAVTVTLGFLVGTTLAVATLLQVSALAALMALGLLLLASRESSASALLGVLMAVGLLHGYAHGAGVPQAATSGAHAAGMLLGSVGLFAAGLGLGRVLSSPRLYLRVARTAGVGMLLLAVAPIAITVVSA